MNSTTRRNAICVVPVLSWFASWTLRGHRDISLTVCSHTSKSHSEFNAGVVPARFVAPSHDHKVTSSRWVRHDHQSCVGSGIFNREVNLDDPTMGDGGARKDFVLSTLLVDVPVVTQRQVSMMQWRKQRSKSPRCGFDSCPIWSRRTPSMGCFCCLAVA